MFKQLLLIVTLSFLFGCNSNDKDFYRTKGGEYASVSGNFFAKFPNEPQISSFLNVEGNEEFTTYVFRSNHGPNKIFTLEYTDFPSVLLSSYSNDEALYQTSIKNLETLMKESFDLEMTKPIEQHGLKGVYYVFDLNDNAKSRGIKGKTFGNIFKVGNRIYKITYSGHPDQRSGEFLDSFRLMK